MSTKWFGIVRWCDDDIAAKLEEMGIEPTDDNVAAVRTLCENDHHFTDGMIEAGWYAIANAIHEAGLVKMEDANE